jgi:hypothetical protein
MIEVRTIFSIEGSYVVMQVRYTFHWSLGKGDGIEKDMDLVYRLF